MVFIDDNNLINKWDKNYCLIMALKLINKNM